MSLDALYAFADEQAGYVHQVYPTWPCAKGCDLLGGANCCHTSLFPVSSTEWGRVKEHILALPHERQEDIKAAARGQHKRFGMKRYDSFAEFFKQHGKKTAPCPLLENNLCSVYESRPTTCRSFGYWQDAESIKACAAVGAYVRTNRIKKMPHWAVLAQRMVKTLKGPVKPLAAWIVDELV